MEPRLGDDGINITITKKELDAAHSFERYVAYRAFKRRKRILVLTVLILSAFATASFILSDVTALFWIRWIGAAFLGIAISYYGDLRVHNALGIRRYYEQLD